MPDEPTSPPDELTDATKRENLLRLAFGGDEARFQEFRDIVRAAVPKGTMIVLRGSAITGERWRNHAPFDAEGPGTSDLDLTLVGDEATKLFKLSGFFVPAVHSRPLSDEDPDIAPALVPLRERLVELTGRPVNIQATQFFVMHLRGDVLGQPYLVLGEVPDEDER